jgi:hypothetical protein
MVMATLLVPIIAVLIFVLVFDTYLSAYFEPKRIRQESTFKIYLDQREWLKEHRECSDWIKELNGPLEPNYDNYDFSGYLRYVEELYSLKNRDLLDEKLMHDLFGSEFISVYEANDFELKHIIEKMRRYASSDYFAGLDFIYKDMKQFN